MARFVAYYRLTAHQSADGLMADAQQAAVAGYIDRVGGLLLDRFTEVQSGSDERSPELQKAIRACQKANAMLVFAKFDRLARSEQFMSELMESGMEFIAADMPDGSPLTIHVIAATTEYERQVISERTKLGLREARNRGTRLGNPNIRAQQPSAVRCAREKADRFAESMRTHIQRHDPNTRLPATALANILNASGIRGPRGGSWTAASVISLRRRLHRQIVGSNSLRTAPSEP